MAKNEFRINDGVLTGYCGKSENVVVPDGVTAIGYNAFMCESKLKSVVIPETVTSIEGNAFDGCAALISIEIPDSVTSIGRNAFRSCRSLTSIVFGRGVTSIGEDAFFCCDKLKTITYRGDAAGWCRIKGLGELMKSSVELTIDDRKVEGDLVISAGVKDIEEYAFRGCTGLTSVVIPEGVKSIETAAFMGCENLTSVTIPNGVKRIGEHAFYGCKALQSVTIPASVARICALAFGRCTALQALRVESTNVTIVADAFKGSDAICALELPDGFQNVKAFACIPKLSYLDFGGLKVGVQPVCNWLSQGRPRYAPVDQIVKWLTENTLATLEWIGKNSLLDAFLSLTEGNWFRELDPAELNAVAVNTQSAELQTAVLDYRNKHYSADSLASYAAEQDAKARGVQEYTVADYAKFFTVKEENGGYVLYDYKGHEDHLVITDRLEGKPIVGIGDKAFRSNKTLTSIVLPEGINSIGNYAFENCDLTSIRLPAGITIIGNGAFAGCKGVTAITLPDGLGAIGRRAFENSGLTSIRLPAGVTSVGDGAFYMCALTTIEVAEGNRAYYVQSDCLIERESMRLAFGLKTAAIPDGVTAIADFAFAKCKGLKSVILPDTVTTIGKYAFECCHDLEELSIGNNVVAIEGYAFFGCDGLTSVRLPDSVTRIGTYAFGNCVGLQSFAIGLGLAEIKDMAFCACEDLDALNYAGTKVQWKAIKKDRIWKMDSGISSVVCADGKLKL